MNPEERLQRLEQEAEDMRYILARKTGIGSADIKGNIIAPSSVGGSAGTNSVGSAAIQSAAVTKSKVSYEEITVNVAAGQTVGTASATSGSVIIGWRPSGNLDQVVDSIAISGTTVTVTLGVAATAQCNFVVILLKA